MMVDFARLRDPVWQAQVRQEREAEQAKLEAHDKKLRAAVELCLMVNDDLHESERSLVRNCRARLNTYLAISEKQEKWLLDVAEREQVKIASRYAGGAVNGEHATFPRGTWPEARDFDNASAAYWAWVLHQIEVQSS